MFRKSEVAGVLVILSVSVLKTIQDKALLRERRFMLLDVSFSSLIDIVKIKVLLNQYDSNHKAILVKSGALSAYLCDVCTIS